MLLSPGNNSGASPAFPLFIQRLHNKTICLLLSEVLYFEPRLVQPNLQPGLT